MNPILPLVAAELDVPVDARVSAMAAAVAALYPKAARAVLFYGSCLRESALEGLMLDFYLVVSSYRDAYGKSWLAPANRLIPPNVFPFVHEGLSAKYAVLSEADFARECSPRAGSVSVYARFAQPARLVWQADADAKRSAVEAVAEAAPTLLGLARPCLTDEEASDPLAVWRRAFELTYGAEIRAERASRPGSIVDHDPERYRRFAEALGASEPLGQGEVERRACAKAWRRRQRKGKRTTVLRLAKASFTFAGGVEYLAWKINRHAGTKIELKPWQRRWPLLAAVTLLPRLVKRGAIR
ncbi:MAG: hypothetical protein E6G94_01355 [Alphaproteobacteria bacterium]|nr:MAG: hypothetical protein E6G94_01355 [Alphaproteobacteria bacterium]